MQRQSPTAAGGDSYDRPSLSSCRAIMDDGVRQICDLIQREQASLPVVRA